MWKMQVSFYLVHYWITAAESYSQHYLELDSRWFAYSASGCHMEASAFIFLFPYSLNKDTYCFLFFKPHPQSNKLFRWREKNTPKQGKTTHLPTEECEAGKNAITALRRAEIPNSPNAQSCSSSHWLWYRYTFLIMPNMSLMNLVWLSLTVLDLISSSAESSWDVGSAEFQFFSKYIHSENILNANEEVDQVKMNNVFNFCMFSICRFIPIICEGGQNFILEDD